MTAALPRRIGVSRIALTGAINAELLRNLWLELGIVRLLGVPLLVAAALALLYTVTGSLSSLPVVVQMGSFIALGVFGVRRAAATVAEEQRAGTWETQRLSALSPRSLAFGKLFGATCFAWYLGLWITASLLLYEAPAQSGLVDQMLRSVAGDLVPIGTVGIWYPALLLALSCLCGQMAAMALSLLMARKSRSDRRMRIATAHVLGLGVTALAFRLLASPEAPQLAETHMLWYGIPLQDRELRLGLLTGLTLLCWLALWRQMAGELMYRPWPWLWPAVTAAAAIFGYGFAGDLSDEEAQQIYLKLWMPLVAAVMATYAGFFLEIKDTVSLTWLGRAVRARDTEQALTLLPLWARSLPFVVVLALGCMAEGQIIGDLPAWIPLPNVPLDGATLGAAALALLAFLLRDLLILHLTALSLQGWRSDWPGVIALGMLYVILPQILRDTGFGETMVWLLPAPDWAEWIWTPALAALTQALVLLPILRWRWSLHRTSLAIRAQQPRPMART